MKPARAKKAASTAAAAIVAVANPVAASASRSPAPAPTKRARPSPKSQGGVPRGWGSAFSFAPGALEGRRSVGAPPFNATKRQASAGLTCRFGEIAWLADLDRADGQDLAALVVAAGGAGAMRGQGAAALAAAVQLR